VRSFDVQNRHSYADRHNTAQYRVKRLQRLFYENGATSQSILTQVHQKTNYL
jgi:ATP-dependent Clp protease adapter protein ClpS